MSVKYISDKEPTLKEMQEYVGGYIELIQLQSGAQMIVNEYGIRLKLTKNKEASFIAGRPIVGHVLFLSDNALLK